MAWKMLSCGCLHAKPSCLCSQCLQFCDSATRFIDRLARYTSCGRVPYHLYVVSIIIVPDNLQTPSPLSAVLLARVLLKARSGVRQSDSTINYIVRSIIQTGCLATAWALAALATWFLLPKISAYRVFDITSGTVYTHVSMFFPLSHLSHLNGGDIFRPCSRRFCLASSYVSA